MRRASRTDYSPITTQVGGLGGQEMKSTIEGENVDPKMLVTQHDTIVGAATAHRTSAVAMNRQRADSTDSTRKQPEHKRQMENTSFASFVIESCDIPADIAAPRSPPMEPREHPVTMASPRTTAARKALLVHGPAPQFLPPESVLMPMAGDDMPVDYSVDRRGSVLYYSESAGPNANNMDYRAMIGDTSDSDMNEDGDSESLFGAAFAESIHGKIGTRESLSAAHPSDQSKQDEIDMFSSMVRAAEDPANVMQISTP